MNKTKLYYVLPYFYFVLKQKIFSVIFNTVKNNLGDKHFLQKYPLLKPLKNFVLSQAKLPITIVQGHKMYLDPYDSMRLSLNPIHEELETSFVKSVLKDGDYALDIGANIGYYTLLFAKIAGNHGKVFAFEPEPSNYGILKKNVILNNYKNVILKNTAVSNKNGQTKLFLSKGRSDKHRIFQSKRVSTKFIMVDTVKLDDFATEHNIVEKISFVKIDVEGAEFDVLLGMKNIINKNQKINLILEFYPSNIKEAGSNPKELLNLLQYYNFEISYVDRIKNQVKKVEDLDKFLQLYDNEDSDVKKRGTNLLCLKNSS